MISDKDKRILKIGVTAAAVFVLLQYLVLPAWDRTQEVRAELPVREQRFAKYLQTVAQEGDVALESGAFNQQLQLFEARLFRSATEALAYAEVQSAISELGTRHKIDVTGSEFLRVKDDNSGYLELPVKIHFQSTMEQMVNLMSDIYVADKLLSISQLGIQPAGGNQKQVLVSMTVGGWIRK